MAGRWHGGPDARSKRGKAVQDSEEEDPEELEASMDADITPAQLDNDDIPDEWNKIKLYLETLQKPNAITAKHLIHSSNLLLNFLCTKDSYFADLSQICLPEE